MGVTNQTFSQALPKSDVTHVTGVTANNDGLCGCNAKRDSGVTDVTRIARNGCAVTPVTSYNARGVTLEAAQTRPVTCVTSVTPSLDGAEALRMVSLRQLIHPLR